MAVVAVMAVVFLGGEAVVAVRGGAMVLTLLTVVKAVVVVAMA
jgi:hypothetical protein